MNRRGFLARASALVGALIARCTHDTPAALAAEVKEWEAIPPGEYDCVFEFVEVSEYDRVLDCTLLVEDRSFYVHFSHDTPSYPYRRMDKRFVL